MIPPCDNSLGAVLLYCVMVWLAFSLALLAAGPDRGLKAAALGGFLTLVLSACIAMLAAYAMEGLGTGLLMAGSFQLVGVGVCAMAVSRVCQMLSWPRTLLAGFLCILGYLLAGLILLQVAATCM